MQRIRPSFLPCQRPAAAATRAGAAGAIPRRLALAGGAALLMFAAARPGACASLDAAGRLPPPGASAGGWFADWFARVSQTQARQPNWMCPLVTVTPELQEELRDDVLRQSLPGGHTLTVFGAGKGLELIPAERIELIIGLPSWETENLSPRKEGWADENFLLKYRLLSANERHGDYIVTAFLGFSFPTGGENFTSRHYVVTPTVAAGKGWGRFDCQGTLGVSVPDNGGASDGAGTPLLLNTALQYHFWKFLWPEVEANYTYWPNGEHDGLNQLFITPALLVGRIPIAGRLGLAVGAGYQVAVTDHPLYRNNFVVTARLPF